MASIEILQPDGETDAIALSKTQTVSIGRHVTCDVRIDEDEVAVLHCRVAWNGSGYEVTSANSSGVDLNGSLVRHQLLRDGDVLRIGSVDLVMRLDAPRESSQRKAARRKPVEELVPQEFDRPSSSEIGLSPVSEEELEIKRSLSERLASEKDAIRQPNIPHAYAPKPEPPRPAPVRPAPPPPPPPPEPEEEEDDIPIAEVVHTDEIVIPRRPPEPEPEKPAAPPSSPAAWQELKRPRRPGERDPLRSPLVLGLAGGSVLMAVSALVIWFLISRNATQKEYDAALDEFNQQRYSQSAELFERFLEHHPRHEYALPAKRGLGRSLIEREIGGATPSWPRGLAALEEFVEQNRSAKDFVDLQADVARSAEKIALGAAKSAEAARKKDLLETSKGASNLLARFGADRDLEAHQQRITEAVAAAETSIARQDTFDVALTAMDAALAAKQPMALMESRRALVEKYATFLDNARLKGLVDKALALEKDLVVREAVDRAASRDERPFTLPPPLTLAPHPRSRTDDVSDGRSVVVLAKDCVFGIDAVTGDPLWRRVLGLDTPFFPIAVSTSLEGWLMFDTRFHELLLIDRRTGKLAWRQEVGSAVSGPPLLHEGQAYLSATDGLCQIDLESGKATTRLRFSQRLMAPPALVAGETKLVVAGDAEMLYTLSLRPLECERVTFFGHRAGTMEAPMMPLGSLLLAIENDRQRSARLRVLDASGEGTWLAETATQRIDGSVRDQPALRGKELFVPSRNERVSAFVVSDKKGQPALAPVVSFQVPRSQPTPISLSVGPDGQLWMASSGLRRLSLKGGAAKIDGPVLAEGILTQPMQAVGKTLYVGRKQPFSEAVLFTQADRDQMVSPWRTVLGAAPLVVLPSGDGVLLLSEQGDIFRLSTREITAGGFRLEAQASLKLPERLTQPLSISPLAGDRLAVVASGATPTLWSLSRAGQVERELKLDAPLEANAAHLAGGLVLPYPGRLKLVPTSGNTKVDDFQLPAGDDPIPRWKQLVELDETTLLALDANGRLSRIQHRTTPVAHLAEVADIALKHPVDVPAVLSEGKLHIADSGKSLQILDASTFEPRGRAELEGTPTALYVVSGRLFVVTNETRVAAFTTDVPLREAWTVNLTAAPAGPPLVVGGRHVLVDYSGTISVVKTETGVVESTISLGQPAAGGAVAAGELIVVPTIDGSLFRLEGALKP
jgi:outer membrane protein assembly factor BamB